MAPPNQTNNFLAGQMKNLEEMQRTLQGFIPVIQQINQVAAGLGQTMAGVGQSVQGLTSQTGAAPGPLPTGVAPTAQAPVYSKSKEMQAVINAYSGMQGLGVPNFEIPENILKERAEVERLEADLHSVAKTDPKYKEKKNRLDLQKVSLENTIRNEAFERVVTNQLLHTPGTSDEEKIKAIKAVTTPEDREAYRITGGESIIQSILGKFEEKKQEKEDPHASLRRSVFYTEEQRMEASQAVALGAGRHLGYDITEATRISKIGQNVPQLMQQAAQAMASEDVSQKNLGNQLNEVVKRLSASQLEFTKQFQSVHEALAQKDMLEKTGGTEEQKKSAETLLADRMEALRKTMLGLDDTEKEANRIRKSIPGGESGEGGGPTWKDKVKAGIETAAAAASLVGGAYMGWKTVEGATFQEGLGKERAYQEGLISTRSLAEQRQIESYDMTKPENLLKYRGDMLFPGRTTFLGEAGRQRALEIAWQEEADRMGMNRAQYQRGIAGAILKGAGGFAQAGVGVATMAAPGAGPLGMAIGGQMGMGGAGQIAGSFTDYAQLRATSAYSQIQGGLAGGLAGDLVWGRDAKRRAELNQAAAAMEIQSRVQQQANNLQNMEAQGRQTDLMMLREFQSFQKVQQEGAILVGARAVTRDQTLNNLYGEMTPAEQFRRGMPDFGGRLSINNDKVGFEIARAEEGTIADLRKEQDVRSRKQVGRKAALDLMNMPSQIPSLLSAVGQPGVIDAIAATASWFSPTSFQARAQEEAVRQAGLTLAVQKKHEIDASIESSREMAKTVSPAIGDRLTSDVGGYQSEFRRNKDRNEQHLQSIKDSMDVTRRMDFTREEELSMIRLQESGALAGNYTLPSFDPKSSAYGAYQITKGTRTNLAKQLGISPDDVFKPGVEGKKAQDMMASRLLDEAHQRVASWRKQYPEMTKQFTDAVLVSGFWMEPSKTEEMLRTGHDVAMPGGQGTVMDRLQQAGKALSRATGTNLPSVPMVLAPVQLERRLEEVTRETRASALGMTPSQFAAHQNMVTNVLVGRQASMDQTEEMIKMGRSGLGSFQSLLGNVATINQVAGGRDNIETLKTVLSSAVAAGFDTSRTAQQFVQTTAGVADALRLTRVDRVAGSLATAAMLTSATVGAPDERGLRMAAEGMKGFQAQMSSQEGVIGAFRMQSLLKAGANIRQQAVLKDVTPMEAGEMMEMLEKGNITNPRLRVLMGTMGGDTPESRQRAGQMLGALREAPLGILRGVYSGITGGKNLDEQIKALGKNVRANDPRLNALMGDVTSAIMAGSGNLQEGLSGASYLLERSGALSPSQAKEKMNEIMAQSQKIYNDPAQIKMSQFVGEVMRRGQGAMRMTSLDQVNEIYGTALKSGMGALTTKGGRVINQELLDFAQGKAVSPEAMQRMGIEKGDTRQSISQEIMDVMKDKSGYDFAKMMEASVAEDAQPVRIANITELSEAIARVQKFGVDKGFELGDKNGSGHNAPVSPSPPKR